MAPKKEDPPATYLTPIHLEGDQIIISNSFFKKRKRKFIVIPKAKHRTVMVHMQEGQLFFLLA